MKRLHIVTPVKDSIQSTLETISAVMASRLSIPHTYTVYNDFSTPENTARLAEAARTMGFTLINLSDLTNHPSPNYLFVLRRARREALAAGAAICLVESDVTVRPDTLRGLCHVASIDPACGMAAAVTVDEAGAVNYPYLYARRWPYGVVTSKRHFSFCCTLLTPALLKQVDFEQLDDSKHWFDVTISHASLAAGLRNYLATNLPVVHRPHQSRPWKLLKQTNPAKYYWNKFTRGLDKI